MNIYPEGALEARSTINAFHAALNRAELVPEKCYRRNKVNYSLVSYVNNIMGLYLSKNYSVIPIFIGRAAQHMEEFPASGGAITYYNEVTRYLGQITFFLGSFTDVAREDIEEFIPPHIRALGKQAPPSEAITEQSRE